ncbi:gamma-glutamyl hydrolase B-like [Leptopilina heterotoma]|uniref:gamma-glutamyl hydrolase B-like n=1 Tax=Leptopilina heterotoma TaxID=63436 RepID=UPI001CA8E83A|nr:gamma-glutamyl hydrolase B-like [Leptopilina heterotoma]
MIVQLFTGFFALLSTILIVSANPVKRSIPKINNEPIIGILSQELIPGLYSSYSNEYDSYIAASYIKFVEGAGAQAVPIWIGKNSTYYEDIMSKLNGVLFPGGDVNFFVSNGYADAGDIIYKIAKRYNDNGDYFPILGICLGFELLTYLSANRVEHRTNCTSVCQAIPLNFTPVFNQSKLFGSTSEKIINILKTDNVTANYHNYCVTKSDLERVNLTDSLRVMSLNNDENGLEFISTIEDKKYPFYGLQFHPEKNDYEWVKGRNIPHSRNATIINQYFADFLVIEARKNFHKFEDEEEKLKTLIYNYNPTYTGLKKSLMIQSYFFKTTS